MKKSTKLFTSLPIAGALLIGGTAYAEDDANENNTPIASAIGAVNADAAIWSVLQLRDTGELEDRTSQARLTDMGMLGPDNADLFARHQQALTTSPLEQSLGLSDGESADARLDVMGTGFRVTPGFLASIEADQDLTPELRTDIMGAGNLDNLGVLESVYVLNTAPTEAIDQRPTLAEFGGTGQNLYGMPIEGDAPMNGDMPGAEDAIPFLEEGSGATPQSFYSSPGPINPDAQGTGGAEVDEATLVFDVQAVTNPTSLLTQPGRDGEPQYNGENGDLQFEIADIVEYQTQPNPETDRY